MSTKTPAQHTLDAISKECFGGKNYNDDFWYEIHPNDTDGTVNGTVHKVISKGNSKEIGDFEIDANGLVVSFPSVEQEFIDKINGVQPGIETISDIGEPLPVDPLDNEIATLIATKKELDADTVKNLAEKYEVSGQTVRNRYKKMKD